MKRYQFKGGELVTRPHLSPLFIPVWCPSIDTPVSREEAARQLKIRRSEEKATAKSTLNPNGDSTKHSSRWIVPYFRELQEAA